MPRALQAKRAREMDKDAVLCTSTTALDSAAALVTHVVPTARALEKWLQVYRTKIALRAVA